MEVPMIRKLFLLCFIARNSALLFHGDSIPGQTTTIGPLGKDATLSLLVQEVLDLKAHVKSQDIEIQTLKDQKASDGNLTVNTVNKLMWEYADIKAAFVVIKQEFDQNNNQTGLLAIKARQDNMAQSIRYLTLSLQDHEIHNEATNMSIYQELGNLNTELIGLWDNTNKTFMKALQNMHNEILRIKAAESSDINRLESLLSTHKTAISSEIGTIQTELQKLKSTLFGTLTRIRISGGGSSGRVEVSILGTWGTICDDGFGDEEAKVVCRMLGQSTSHARAYSSAHFGQGGGPILFDDLNCNGQELNLFDCGHRDIGHHNCGHNEDAGVSCG